MQPSPLVRTVPLRFQLNAPMRRIYDVMESLPLAQQWYLADAIQTFAISRRLRLHPTPQGDPQVAASPGFPAPA